ncbi:GSCFA domain-containing protein [Flagellimonas flava]|uniref:GSCFA family protein n=1 Tax=Flagellimonas flava TaxID=570519 RepID=A0A1M5JVW0_9FLAO|nr:GSCFA domain-containing protein [Allomuricauda flava]SHG44701.1 GSCFA family protein [Allomuricauda flava]
MKLQTQIPLKKSKTPLTYQSKVVLLGSCFAENIASKLNYYQFQHKQNPFGILFQPLAIENLISRAVKEQEYTHKESFEQDGLWLCFDAHSEIHGGNGEALLQNLNSGLTETKKWLTEASHILITLGTAWGYRNKSTQKMVANCHKVPQKEFQKELLSVDQIETSLKNSVGLIQSINPQAEIIFTVSPVRHLKDGFVENQRSKAHLLAALHGFMSHSNFKLRLSYFESYEIMMDELRDYRFYGKDLVHPNELAVDYIWEKFKSVWIAETSYPEMDKVDAVQKGLQHRPFHPESESHQKFEASLRSKIAYLKERYPFMNFG